MTTRTYQLKAAGQSLWLDNIQRRELHDGALQKMIDTDGICGITSNPTIFMNAVSKSTDYDDQIRLLAGQGAAPEAVYHAVTVQDIRDAGTLLLPVYEQTAHEDGFVSIELNPQLAFKVEESITPGQGSHSRNRAAQYHDKSPRHERGAPGGAAAADRGHQCQYHPAV